jgi:primosomal protein N'
MTERNGAICVEQLARNELFKELWNTLAGMRNELSRVWVLIERVGGKEACVMVCAKCGRYNPCPACNGWLCEQCGADLRHCHAVEPEPAIAEPGRAIDQKIEASCDEVPFGREK